MLEASLLDDARFLEELAKIEALPDEDTSVFPKPVPTVGDIQPPTAIADALPPALGPRMKGPQFVLAPPPSKRRGASYRNSSRSAARGRKTVADEAPDIATATENIAATASDSVRAPSDEQGSTPALEPLYERERDIVHLLALGYTNQEIGKRLFISVRTVDTHRAHIMRKLRLETRAELVMFALANGLIGSDVG